MKLALDAMGGDNAPQINIDGAKLALQQVKGLEKLCLVGDESTLKQLCEAAGIAADPRLEIVHAPEVVGMDESGLLAVRKKRNSSMSIAVDLVKNGTCDAVLSAGNTGAAVAASTIKLRLLPGVERAGIISPIPNPTGYTLVSDTGANPDATPSQQVGYAVMAAIVAKYLYDHATPRVAVMSNGTEDCKGCETSLATYALLHGLAEKGALPFEFAGNSEGHDLLESDINVFVTNGFTGNILLKSVEATAKTITHMIRGYVKKSPIAILGAVLMKGVFSQLKNRMNADAVGGSPLMGVNGVSIIAHGSANGTAILNAIRMAEGMCRHNVNDRIVAAMETVNAALHAQN